MRRDATAHDDDIPHIGIGQEPLADADADLQKLLPEVPLPNLPVWLAMHRDVRTSMRIRRVADFLHEELKRYSAGMGSGANSAR